MSFREGTRESHPRMRLGITRQMTEKDTIAQILDRSTVDAPKSTELAELSELDREEMDTFKTAWSPLGPERRRHIISRLVELAEDNIELNFNEIFKLALSDADEEVRVKGSRRRWRTASSRATPWWTSGSS